MKWKLGTVGKKIDNNEKNGTFISISSKNFPHALFLLLLIGKFGKF